MSTVQAITTGVQARLIRRVLLALSLALVFTTPLLTHAQESGAGTTYMECRDDAFIEMGICYLNATRYLSKVRCNIAFELDLWGCNSDLVEALNPIL